MNLEELEKHVRYCIEIEDLSSLYIIQYLLYHEIETKKKIWEGFQNIVCETEVDDMTRCPECGSKKDGKSAWIREQVLESDNSISKEWESYICEDCLYFICENMETGEIMKPVSEELEILFEVSFSHLHKKGYIITDRNEMNAFMLGLDKPPEEYGKEGEKKIKEIQQLCFKTIDERIGSHSSENQVKPVGTYEEIARLAKDDTNQTKYDFSKPPVSLDWKFTKQFRDIGFTTKESTNDELREKIKETLDEITEDSALFNTGDDLEWIKNKPKEEQNCIHIRMLLDRTEKQLRQLLLLEGFEISKTWLPKGLTDKREFIEKKQENALKQFSGNPKILTPERQFLNAVTLGELIEIIIYTQHNHKIFSDVFEDFKQMEVYFLKELKILRDQMAHNDEQISCTDDLVAKAKTVTNEINSQILAWRGI